MPCKEGWNASCSRRGVLRYSSLVRLPWLYALVTLAGCLGRVAEGGVNAATGASSPGDSALQQQARMDERALEPMAHSATCIAGSVSTKGALGAGLPRVTVDIDAEGTASGPQLRRVAETDARGEFHFCLPREETGQLARALTDAPPYGDRTFEVHLRFRRAGYSETTAFRIVTTGAPPRRIDVVMSRLRAVASLP